MDDSNAYSLKVDDNFDYCQQTYTAVINPFPIDVYVMVYYLVKGEERYVRI